MSSQQNLCLHWANKYDLYVKNDSVIILLQQSQLSLQVHTDPPCSFAKWCCTKFICTWDVWRVAYTAAKVWLAMKTSIMSSILLLLNAPSASSVTTALMRGSCRSIRGRDWHPLGLRHPFCLKDLDHAGKRIGHLGHPLTSRDTMWPWCMACGRPGTLGVLAFDWWQQWGWGAHVDAKIVVLVAAAPYVLIQDFIIHCWALRSIKLTEQRWLCFPNCQAINGNLLGAAPLFTLCCSIVRSECWWVHGRNALLFTIGGWFVICME